MAKNMLPSVMTYDDSSNVKKNGGKMTREQYAANRKKASKPKKK